MGDLHGRVALVNGGAQGIGAASVRRLTHNEASCVALDLDETAGGAWEDVVKGATDRAAVRRIGQPEDIAAVIALLASPDSGFVTGQIIYATGSPAV